MELKAALALQVEPLEWEVSVDDFLSHSPFHLTPAFQRHRIPSCHFPVDPPLPRPTLLTAVLGVAPTAAQEEWAAWYLGLWLASGPVDTLSSECITLVRGPARAESSTVCCSTLPVFGELMVTRDR